MLRQAYGPTAFVLFLACCGSDHEAPGGGPDGSNLFDGGTWDGATHRPGVDSGFGTDASENGGGGGDASVPPPCKSTPGSDDDGDGFPAGPDCNDCDPLINPAAYDIAGNGVDEDCSGMADDEPSGCDVGLDPSGTEAGDAARALGLCRKQVQAGWGLMAARWVFPDGSELSRTEFYCPDSVPPHPLSHAILESYGTHNLPTEGQKLVSLASGVARPGTMKLGNEWQPAIGTSPDGAQMCILSGPPPGFPKAASSCVSTGDGATSQYIYDGIALELTIKVPSNALSFNFDFNFLSTEFPAHVCSGKNDHFVALLDSAHPSLPADKNVSYDSMGNVVSVDSAFMEVCRPATLAGRTFDCPRGPKGLEGTGMDREKDYAIGVKYLQGGSTGWLRTQAPVVPGETIKIRFAIWDTDDPVLDSTVLLDHVHWTLAASSVTPPPVEEPETDWVLF